MKVKSLSWNAWTKKYYVIFIHMLLSPGILQEKKIILVYKLMAQNDFWF